MYTIGEKYLITTDSWFMAPDGQMYKAVFGAVKEILGDEETLGIKTNRGSTNWYVSIGNMLVAGCQIHYAIKTESVSTRSMIRDIEHKGEITAGQEATSRIYTTGE